MNFFALQPQPERSDYGKTVLAALDKEFDYGMSLTKILVKHCPPDVAESACQILGWLHDEVQKQRDAHQQELAWRRWVMARQYFQLTGTHIEENEGTSVGPKVNGNIYDITAMLPRRNSVS